MPNPIATLAALALAAGAFALGLTMGQNNEAPAETISILVGTGCEGSARTQYNSEEDGFGLPCKEIVRREAVLL